ncbi:transcription regulator ArsR [Paenibacillus sp. J23TS9]|uniref:Metalloregulator ArsR/SmtB family transcription factor n=1 Tax=Paenibacillus dokdonensis TaxID=2567944 RepID=A0ABU6GRP3_9BACL|nr:MULTISPECIES: metalloregulator ArsR/SmtB family transcription factor [Paenibacillus]MEC0242394.1 metalloregulator ArsR/SmtB family transcription factor [Paenibacillus dokdonensis]GIP26952.1 transcription regulator ArsR [Paenibacillus sp. J23TS9]
MEQSVNPIEECDATCMGSESELSKIKEGLIDDQAASQVADWFKAFSDPTRVKLINALLQRELCVHDLTILLGMGQSAVSHQLRYLRNLRIVKRRKDGKTVYYSLDDTHIEQIFVQTLQHTQHG